MKKLLTGIALFALLFTTTGISNQAFAQTDATRPDVSCEEARKHLADMMNRYDAIKRKIYSEWQQAHESGRYTGSWEEYAREHFDALPDVQELRKLQERYNNIIRQCAQTDKPRPSSTDSRPTDVTACREAYDAKKKLSDFEARYNELKRQFYNEWSRMHESGTYDGDWSQYAEEKFLRSPEVQEMQKLRERYNHLVDQCQNTRPVDTRPTVDKIRPTVTDKPNCDDAERKMNTLQEMKSRLLELEREYHEKWQRIHESGEYAGDWTEFRKEHVWNTPEFLEYNSLVARYGPVHKCLQDKRPTDFVDRPDERPDTSDVRPVTDTNHDELQSLREENKKLKGEIERLKSIIQEQLSVIMNILSRMKSSLN